MQHHEITVWNPDGANYARFMLVPAEGWGEDHARVYWGGLTGYAAQGTEAAEAMKYGLYGTHFYVQLDGMLDILAKLAQAEHPFSAYAPGHVAGPLYLRQDMAAGAVADLLGCQPQTVIDHFRLLVRVYEDESETVSSG
jgi:hypothetical protein